MIIIIIIIITHYNYFKEAWAEERWDNSFFSLTIPYFAISERLKVGGCIYLPNYKCIDTGLFENFFSLSDYYKIYRFT